MSITLRRARPEDASAIYDMIYELAVYEKPRKKWSPHRMRFAKHSLVTAAIPKH